mmetsp:Transcript_1223/g.2925  ORF Transcript_1223/g.2925 Transcript_1223/m.2925 type:complete len:181 (-) Transcript_1223:437-979(-)
MVVFTRIQLESPYLKAWSIFTPIPLVVWHRKIIYIPLNPAPLSLAPLSVRVVLVPWRRPTSSAPLNSTPLCDGVAEQRERQPGEPQRIPLTVKREALSLYRDVIRYSRLFVWRDEHGRQWGQVLRENARREFEASRFEMDPEVVNRMLIVGRESIEEVKKKFLAKRQQIIDEESEQTPEH